MANRSKSTASELLSDSESESELHDILSPFLKTSNARYESAPWLLSRFDDPVWNLSVGSPLTIDWRVRVAGGELLTSGVHSELWKALRSWIILQNHVDCTGGRTYCTPVVRNALIKAIHCIDYFLINASNLQLARHGLSEITLNELRAMIATMGSSRSLSESIYKWSTRLSSYLREKIATLSESTIEEHLESFPMLGMDIPDIASRMTDLSESEIISSRVWIYRENLYKPGQFGTFHSCPHIKRIAQAIYIDAVWGGNTALRSPIELYIGSGYRRAKEYPRARVTSEHDERMSQGRLTGYLNTVMTLPLLETAGLRAPKFDVEELRNVIGTLDLKSDGRFRTLPQDVVLRAFKLATEYVLENGDALVDSYLAACRVAIERNTSLSISVEQSDRYSTLSERARELGVCSWTIEPGTTGHIDGPQRLDQSAYYAALRSNVGLYESIRVLYGAIQIVVGTLMARRQGELQGLIAGSCLDASGTRLTFKNGKSGLGDLRELETRPIPAVAARMIRMLERLQKGLLDIGSIRKLDYLFCYPKGTRDPSLASLSGHDQMNASIDYFCDWAQLPLDSNGHRYYIRQHQLRRFFSMLFFYGGGFGGLDTLRWFLGHNDAKHVWNYITESTPGATIRSVAAEWAIYNLKHATKEAESLCDELTAHFGTKDFRILETKALQDYIEDLMEEGRLIIEPHFLDKGREYRIACTLKSKGTTP